MHNFAYHRPVTLDEALALRRDVEGARFIAGGTDLMVRIREGSMKPPALISLRRIEALREITVGAPTRIGALATVAQVQEHEALCQAFPALGAAAGTLGSVQIRNAATVGGNLCNASPCADMAPPLLVHDARMRIQSLDGDRELPLEDFFVAPGETRLSHDEVLAELIIDEAPASSTTVFLKKSRVAMDIAIASIAMRLELDGDRCMLARVAAGSLGPRPMRLHDVEATLTGKTLDDATIARARKVASEEVQPISDVRAGEAYRRHLAGAFVERAVGRILAGVGS